MNNRIPVFIAATLAASLMFSAQIRAETLNPEGINPHADAPRKRITQKQKLAAAEAMKKKKAEIEARKATNAHHKNSDSVPNVAPSYTRDSSENSTK